jgi:hypothetical protein
MKIACRRLLKVLAVSLVIVFGLGVFPCDTQAITLSELLGGKDIQIDNLRFFNFSFVDLSTGTEADSTFITVETVGAGTPYPGIIIHANGNSQLSATHDIGSMRQTKYTRFSYEVETLDSSPLIEETSLTLVPYSLKIGRQAEATLRQTLSDIPETLVVQKILTIDGVKGNLDGKVMWVSPQNSVSIGTLIVVDAQNYQDLLEIGQASIAMIEQVFSLAPSLANAGPDQVVFDKVDLDASGSADSLDNPTFIWDLVPRDDTLPSKSASGEKPTVEGLEKGLYDLTLTVTDHNGEGPTYTDTMLLAAAGPCEAEPPPPPQESGELKLWDLDIKKYRFSNWASASVHGTFDASGLPLNHYKHKRGLKAKVTIQVVDEEGNPLEWSGDTKAEIRNYGYKCVIHKRH